jgi:hypothetical protein
MKKVKSCGVMWKRVEGRQVGREKRILSERPSGRRDEKGQKKEESRKQRKWT